MMPLYERHSSRELWHVSYLQSPLLSLAFGFFASTLALILEVLYCSLKVKDGFPTPVLLCCFS